MTEDTLQKLLTFKKNAERTLQIAIFRAQETPNPRMLRAARKAQEKVDHLERLIREETAKREVPE